MDARRRTCDSRECHALRAARRGAGSGALRALGIGALLFSAAASAAEAVNVRVGVSSTSVYAGEHFVYQIQVEGAKADQPPTVPAAGDLQVKYAGEQDASSHSTFIVNGRVTQQIQAKFLYSYEVTALRPGALTIPQATVVVGGRNYSTQPITLSVQRAAETDDLKLRVSLMKEKAYVGEPVRLHVTCYFRKDLRNVTFSMALPANAFKCLNVPELQMTADDLARRRYHKLEFLGDAVIAALGQERLGAVDFTTLSFEKILLPQTPGRYDVGPATADLTAVVGRKRGGGFFEDPFFGREETQKFVIPSNAPVLQVLPLPEGAPATFAGLVGTYSLDASAEPTTVNVGDPITLTIRIKGPPPLECVPAPALGKQADLVQDFKVPEDAAPPKVEGGAKVFVQTLRARSDRAKAIPPLELACLDPATGKYQIVRSARIPLVVRETHEVTAKDAVGLPGQPAATQAVEDLMQGIAYNYEDLDALSDQRFSLGALLRRPSWIALLSGPMLAYLILAGVLTMKRRADEDVSGRRRRGALSAAQRQIRQAGGAAPQERAAIVGRALCGYVADVFGRPAAGLMPAEAVGLLRGKNVPQTQAVSELLERCDAARFAGLELSAAEELAGRALALLEELETALRRTP